MQLVPALRLIHSMAHREVRLVSAPSLCPHGTGREPDLLAKSHRVAALVMPSRRHGLAQAHSETVLLLPAGTQGQALVVLHSSPCSSSAACTNHVPVITTLLRGGMWRLPFSLLSHPHPHVLTSACSPRGPCRCPGPSWPHTPAPGQVKAEHPAGRPLPVPGSRAAGGEAGECPSCCASRGTQQAPQTPRLQRQGSRVTSL